MKILLDTHAFLWWLFDDPKLPETARAVIASADNTILVSAACAWEITTKHRLGKMPEAGDVASDVPGYVRKARMTELPISIAHAACAGALPGPHRDPFDRMLIAQSTLEKAPVITIDPVFADYRTGIIWS